MIERLVQSGLVNRLPMGLLVFRQGLKKECVFMNDHAKRTLLGPDAQDPVESLAAKDFFSETAEQTIRVAEIRLLGSPGFYQDVRVLSRVQAEMFVSCWVQHTEVDGQIFISCYFQNINPIKKVLRELEVKQSALTEAYQTLVKQHEDLKAVDLAKIKFIALVSHEMRTPLSSLLTATEILKAEIYPNDKVRQEITRTVYSQTVFLKNFVDNVLDFSRLESGAMDYFLEQGSPEKMGEEEVQAFADKAALRGIAIHIVKNPVGTDLTCYFDPLRLRQVIANVISNAIKYNQDSGSITISYEPHLDYVDVLVQDTGIGIAANQEAKVFSEFETLGNTLNHELGTGLGMAISKRIMSDMGGDITYQSVLGNGTTFKITLPRQRSLGPDLYRRRPDVSGDLIG